MNYEIPDRRFALETESRQVDTGLGKLSYVLDEVFRVPGTNIRFGLDPIIGFLLPMAGDSITVLMALYIVLKSITYGLPKVVIGKMIFNIGVDYVVGSIPFLGDFLDFGLKANKKNLDLLNRFAGTEKRPQVSDWLWVFLLVGLLGGFIIGWLLLIIWALKSVSLPFMNP